MRTRKGHYIHFTFSPGKLTERQYEQIKLLAYSDQLKQLIVLSDEVITSPETSLEELTESDKDEPG